MGKYTTKLLLSPAKTISENEAYHCAMDHCMQLLGAG